MSKVIDSNNKIESSEESTAPEHERQCRLASAAIVRGQTKALRRYLAEGLDPNSNFYDGRMGPPHGRLIRHALWIGSVECFKILMAAGAEVGQDEIEISIDGVGGDTRVLRHLLESGRLDPSGGPDASISWVEYAARHPDASYAKTVLIKEICKRERDALNSSVAPASAHRTRRSL